MSFSDRLVAWLQDTGLFIALTLLGAIVLVRVAKFLLHRLEKRWVGADGEVPTEAAKRAKALSGIAGNIVAVFVSITAGAMILEKLGVKTASLIASVGVLGLAIGIGAQSLARDLVSGFLILVENQYGVDDVVRLQTSAGAIEGTVEKITLRSTLVRGVDGEAQFVPNGEIKVASNLSKEWARVVIDLPVRPALVDEASDALEEAGTSLYADSEWRDLLLSEPRVLGIEDVTSDSVTLRISVRVMPLKQWDVSRELRHRVVRSLAKAGIVGDVREVGNQGSAPQGGS